MSLKKPDAIFFDWDGTLIDGFDVIFSSYNVALKHFGLPAMSIEQARKNVRLSSREVFPQIFGKDAEEAQKIYYQNVLTHHLEHIKTIPETLTLLQFVKAHNIPMGVVSNKTHAILLKEVEHMGWDNYFSVVVGAGVAAKDKPAADPLLLACDKLDLSPDTNELWYIGDTETDMQAAYAAKFTSVFIEHGLGEISQQNQFPPTISVNNHAALIEQLRVLV